MGGWRRLGMICTGLCALAGPATATVPEQVRVMIVTAFADEAQAWEQARTFKREIPVPGLPVQYPAVKCGDHRVCLVTTGMGHANAAASIAALVFSRTFDLRHTWWVVTGIAGMNPSEGTLGSAAWAEWLVEWGLQWELDALGRVTACSAPSMPPQDCPNT